MATQYLDSLQLSSNLTVMQSETIQGNETVLGTSTLTGNTTVGGTLGVTGTSTFTGALTANGGVTGNLTGNIVGYDLATPQVIPGDGAITINPGFSYVALTKGSAAAITIAAPTTPAQDGCQVLVFSETAYAHVVTCSTDGFNAKGSSGTMTASAAAANYFWLIARNGHWWITGNANFTKA